MEKLDFEPALTVRAELKINLKEVFFAFLWYFYN